MQLRQLINECLSPEVAAQLRQDGHDAVYVQEIGLGGAPDDTVYAQARLESRVLVTLNYRHFSDTRRYPDPTGPGVIALRLRRSSPRRVLDELRAFLGGKAMLSLNGRLFILEDGGIVRPAPSVVAGPEPSPGTT